MMSFWEQKNNPIVNKSKVFALHIIDIYKYVISEKREFVLSKQVLRSGTSIGANIREAQKGMSTMISSFFILHSSFCKGV